MYAFYPAEGQPEVAITGVGLAGSEGLPLDRAAVVMPELQKPELDGAGLPTGERIPLEGDELVKAAQEWAARSGLVVRDTDAPEPPIFKPTGTDASASQPPKPAVVTAPAPTLGVDTPPQEA
jgi:hypothetical protein